MERLWLSILILCYRYGEIEGLNELSQCLCIDASRARKILALLEHRDTRLKVVRRGQGRRTLITYKFEEAPRNISIRWFRKRVLSLDRDLLYRGVYGRTE